MEYRETPPPAALEGLVKTYWTLHGPGGAETWHRQQATPDGCVEIIRRLSGRSRWNGDQPRLFCVGLIDRPEPFEFTGDARFVGVRLWPWAWAIVSGVPLPDMRGRWLPYEGPDAEAVASRLHSETALAATGRAIVAAGSVAQMARATGMAPRTLQRWFAARLGISPRGYLMLLRFQKAFEQVPARESLAEHAVAKGFADQAHMARSFRQLAGVTATAARRSAVGPFLPGDDEGKG
jgi:AraC-like DNA-binding protein